MAIFAALSRCHQLLDKAHVISYMDGASMRLIIMLKDNPFGGAIS
jgi:hypothetical protein